MMQIQKPAHCTNAAARSTKEKLSVRLYEPRLSEVPHRAKGHTARVRFSRKAGMTFDACTCAAGTPTRGRRIPLICKPLLAAVLLACAVRQMRAPYSYLHLRVT